MKQGTGRRFLYSIRGILAMNERAAWSEIRDRRLAEPGALRAYEATRLAYELGRTVREARGWTQTLEADLIVWLEQNSG